jgi:transposase
VRQAKALVMAGEGVANEEIAWRVGVTPNTVRRWRGSSSSKKVRRGRTSLSEVTSPTRH